MDNDRFIKVYSQGKNLASSKVEIFIDTATGVNYIFCQEGYAGGLTPLLDPDGKPVVTIVNKKN